VTLRLVTRGRTWAWDLVVAPQEQLPVEESAEPAEPSASIEAADDAGRVHVDWSDSDEVSVDWTGRATLHFNDEDLRDRLLAINTVAAFGDVWVEHQDSVGTRYRARVLDGEFTAGAPDGCSEATIPWGPFEDALEQALSTHDAARKDVMT
jgi:hypothetical protein